MGQSTKGQMRSKYKKIPTCFHSSVGAIQCCTLYRPSHLVSPVDPSRACAAHGVVYSDGLRASQGICDDGCPIAAVHGTHLYLW